jgi:hypothetical protein
MGGRHATSFRGPSLSLLAVAILEMPDLFIEINALRQDYRQLGNIPST